MPLSVSNVNREPLHTRTLEVKSYQRDDDLIDLEAVLLDVKAYDFLKHGGLHKAGDPIHHMLLRVTIDDSFTVVHAEAAYEAAPYGEHCTCIAPSYQGLVGLNLLKDFKNKVKERFARLAGCTHLTELSYILPTAAVQSMSRRWREKAEAAERAGVVAAPKRPFQLDGCHALDSRGPVALRFYPEWYVGPGEKAECN